MHFASMNRQSCVVRWLAKTGHANMALERSHENKRALNYACESGDELTLDFLLHLPSHMVQWEAFAVEAAQEEIAGLELTIRYMQESSEEQQLAAIGLTAQQLATLREESFADKCTELEAAQLRAGTAHADLVAAKGQFVWLTAASEGWVEAAIASPFTRVSDDAKRYQADTAAEEALTATLPKLLADGAPLAAFVELEEHLKRSRLGDSAGFQSQPRDSNPWLKVVRDATEHGRADLLRWFYSPPCLLSHMFNYKRPVEDDYGPPPPGGCETYEGVGRQLATQCEQEVCREFTQLYDDLRAADAAMSAGFSATDGPKQVFGFTKDKHYHEQVSDFAEPTIANVLGAVVQIDAVCAMFPDGMRPDWVRGGVETFDPQISYLEEKGGSGHSRSLVRSLTFRNFAASRGYLSLVRWFVEERPWVIGRDVVEEVVRMVFLTVSHLPFEHGPNTLDTLAYLLHWLLARDVGPQLVVSARFAAFGVYGYNDEYHSPDDFSGLGRQVDPDKSLLDVAVDNAVVMVPCYQDNKKDSLVMCLERCWKCIDLLQALVPACELTCFSECAGRMTPLGRKATEWWSERKSNVLRFLRLAESKGVDLSGSVTHRNSEISLAQALANCGWISAVRWLAEERGIDVQHLTFNRWQSLIGEELGEQIKDAVVRVQRAQRQRHERRPVP